MCFFYGGGGHSVTVSYAYSNDILYQVGLHYSPALAIIKLKSKSRPVISVRCRPMRINDEERED